MFSRFRRSSQRLSRQVVVLLLMAVGCVLVLPSRAEDTGPQDGRKVTLKQQLTTGLRAVTPADKAFINGVVAKVEQGVLPRSLVDSTFLWAREKANAKSASRALRPMVYFRPGLLARTRKLGIRL